MTEEEDKDTIFRPVTLTYLKASKDRRTSTKNQDEVEACTPQSVAQEPNITLESGSTLPRRMKPFFSNESANIPLQDIDNYYEDKQTFVIINGQKTISRFNSANSCWLFGPLNIIRKCCLRISLHWLFHLLMLLTILFNIVILSIPTSKTIEMYSTIFPAIYLIEIIIKIISQGFILEKFSYLRDSWNWLDFLLTIPFFTEYFLDTGVVSLNALRAFRFLKYSKKGRLVLSAIRKSFINLKDFYILYGFLLSLLSVLGLQLYMGTFSQTCVLLPNETMSIDEFDKAIHNSGNWLNPEELCGNASGSRQCISGSTCIDGIGENPDYGYTNYDNFGWSILSTFRLMTEDFWEDLLTKLIQANGSLNVFYCLLTFIIGSLYLMNLISAIISVSYDMAKKHDDFKEEKDYDDSIGLLLDSSFYIKKSSKLTDDTEEKTEKHSKCQSILNSMCSWECNDYFTKLRKSLFKIIYDPFMDIFMNICNIILLISFSLDHVDMPVELASVLSKIYSLMVILFAIETTLKIIASSPFVFFKDSSNTLDCFLIYPSLFNLTLAHVAFVSFINCFMLVKCFIRLVTLFKVATCFPNFQNIYYSVKRSWDHVGHLIWSTLLFCVIFTCIGLNFFGIDYYENRDRFEEGIIPRWNFMDFMHSFMVVFRILCGEWVETLWHCLLVSGWSCIPFYITVIIVGNFMFVNIFLAIILVNYGPVKKLSQKDVEYVNLYKSVYNRIKGLFNKNQSNANNQEDELKNDKNNIELNETDLKEDEDKNDVNHQDTDTFSDCKKSNEAVLVNCCPDFGILTFGNEENPEGFWKSWKNIRDKCLFLVNNLYFQIIVALIIIFACFLLAYEDMFLKSERPVLENFYFYIIRIICISFIIEISIKLFGLGFKTYFKNVTRIVDLIAVLFLAIDLLIIRSPFLRAFLAFRMLHILNLMRRKCQNMKIILNAIQKATPEIISIIFIQLVFILFFAILGVQLFGGKFYRCLDENGQLINITTVPYKQDCIQQNFTWQNEVMNFDNIYNAYFSLLEVCTAKGWISIIHSAVDSRSYEDQPDEEGNLYMFLFFAIFMLYQSFFFLKLFIGALLKTFKEEIEKVKCGLSPKTDVQRNYYKAVNAIRELKLPQVIPKPEMKPLQLVYNLVTNFKFDFVMWIIIMVLIILMAIDSNNTAAAHILKPLSHIYIAIFILECIVKLAAWRQHYFKNLWNIYELIFVIILLLEFAFTFMPVSRLLLAIPRALKGFQIIKFSKYTKGVTNLYKILLDCSGFVLNLLIIIFVFLFIYSIMGMFLFKDIKYSGSINEIYNFKTFGASLLTLIQISTKAGWDGVFHGLINEVDCFNTSDCGNFNNGAIYIVTFLYIICFVVMNMFVVINIYHYCQLIINSKSGLFYDQYDEYFEKWMHYDQDGTGFISLKVLPEFLASLSDPFKTSDDKKSVIIAMDISIYKDDKVKFNDVLEALAKLNFDKHEDGLMKVPSKDQQLKENESLSSTSQIGREDVFSKEIQASWQTNDEKQSLA